METELAVTDRYSSKEMGDLIRSYKIEIGFPAIDTPKGVTEILAKVSNYSTLKVLTSVELIEYATVLQCYAFYLTCEEGRHKAYLNWLENNIAHIVGKNLNEVQGYWNEKNSYIRATEPLAAELGKYSLTAQAKLDSIAWSSQKIGAVAKQLETLADAKIKEKYRA